jgi:tetratricopeptide (TPR) repeat protein
LLAGDSEHARVAAARALDLARRHGERGDEAWALRLFGEVDARLDRAADALDHYERSLSLAEELEMRPLVAHCQLGLGRLCRRTGKHELAQEHLTTTTTMYREMDMRF